MLTDSAPKRFYRRQKQRITNTSTTIQTGSVIAPSTHYFRYFTPIIMYVSWFLSRTLNENDLRPQYCFIRRFSTSEPQYYLSAVEHGTAYKYNVHTQRIWEIVAGRVRPLVFIYTTFSSVTLSGFLHLSARKRDRTVHGWFTQNVYPWLI